MCGFTITKETIPNLIKHRGSEEVNELYSNWNVCFNSLPLSSNNQGIKQPLVFSNCILVFNGEIFNYKELNPRAKSDLHYLQDIFKSFNQDIIKLYTESIKWDGFWAISIIYKNSSIYSFTDPLGKKQLYYSSKGISSEIKTLIDSEYRYMVYDIYSFGRMDTNFSNIFRFIPGVLYCYSYDNSLANRISTMNYFKGILNGNLYDLIEKSVTDRLENRIDGISLLLSSGLDSNIVLHHVMKKTKDINIVSYMSDESETVKDICDKNGLEVTFVENDESYFKDAIYCYEHSLDYGSLLPNYLLFKNCKNSFVLTGDGSDELFGGYQRSLQSDTWDFDVFKELPYYHNIRIDRTSMIHTKEARSPLMSNRLVHLSRSIPYKDRQDKKVLRDVYKEFLPTFVVEGKKKPLRHKNDKDYNLNKVKEKHFEIWQNQK